MNNAAPQAEAPIRPKRLISVMDAYSRISISRTEGDRRVVNDPDFPKKINIGGGPCGRTIRFLESDVDAYIDLLIERSTSKPPSQFAGTVKR